MINTAISDRPAGMTITMHLCRGNFKSMWIAQGGYEPLRFAPKGKTVVLELVTSKMGTLETKDHLKRRMNEAAKYLDLDQLCLSPQCCFASTEEGNVLAESDQWAKLARIVEVANEVWGTHGANA